MKNLLIALFLLPSFLFGQKLILKNRTDDTKIEIVVYCDEFIVQRVTLHPRQTAVLETTILGKYRVNSIEPNSFIYSHKFTCDGFSTETINYWPSEKPKA